MAAEIEDEPLYKKIGHNRWLMANVIPHLPLRARDGITQPSAQYPGRFYLDDDDNRIMPRRMIRNAVRAFVQATPDVELWADYGAYDHVVLAQLFGRMIDLPEGFPMWTHDLRQEIARLREPVTLPDQESGEHNALADARHLKRCAELVLARA